LNAIQQPIDARPQLVDARSHERFAGKEEPIDPVAGHIVGAICLPFTENLEVSGKFKSPAALAARFAQISESNDVVCYCGSGVTATHNILAARIAGLPEPALYADSWSGWITDPQRPYETLNDS
jgi:thiosulfate/3-mercaptopyruvate sulfurtransferase